MRIRPIIENHKTINFQKLKATFKKNNKNKITNILYHNINNISYKNKQTLLLHCSQLSIH